MQEVCEYVHHMKTLVNRGVWKKQHSLLAFRQVQARLEELLSLSQCFSVICHTLQWPPKILESCLKCVYQQNITNVFLNHFSELSYFCNYISSTVAILVDILSQSISSPHKCPIKLTKGEFHHINRAASFDNDKINTFRPHSEQYIYCFII